MVLSGEETTSVANCNEPPTTTDETLGVKVIFAGTTNKSPLTATPVWLLTTKRPELAPLGTVIVKLLVVAATTGASIELIVTWLFSSTEASKPPPLIVTDVPAAPCTGAKSVTERATLPPLSTNTNEAEAVLLTFPLRSIRVSSRLYTPVGSVARSEKNDFNTVPEIPFRPALSALSSVTTGAELGRVIRLRSSKRSPSG